MEDFTHEVIIFFAIILTVAGLMTFIFHKIKQPLILGYLVAGIVIGPYGLKLVHMPEVLDASAEMGVLLLLFGIGLEFPLSKLRKLGLKTYAIIAIIELILMFGFSFLAGLIMGWSMMDCLFLGAALGSSSTVVIAKVLTGMGKMKDVSTTIMMGVLVVEDLAVVLILSILSSVVGTENIETITLSLTLGKILLFLFGAMLIGLAIIPRALNWASKERQGETHSEQDEVIMLTALGLCFGLSIMANFVGLSMAMGAFLMGIIVAESKVGESIHHNTSRIKEMFGALFFVSVGALIDITQFSTFIVPALVVIVIMVFGKVVGCSLGTRLVGYNLSVSLKVGMGLGQIGEFAFIVAKAGMDLGVVSDFLFPTIGVAVAITTIITPYLIRLSYKLEPDRWWQERKQRLKASS
ncbi:MAG: cation:proton antiporter [Dehalococcoidia bacterium]|nr:cation:proton antiporter [Dehalococcoidia bacterium]